MPWKRWASSCRCCGGIQGIELYDDEAAADKSLKDEAPQSIKPEAGRVSPSMEK